MHQALGRSLQILGQIQLLSQIKPNKHTWTSGQTQWGQFGAQPIWWGCWNESLMQNSQITNNANSRVSNIFRPEGRCSAFHLSQIEEHVWHKGISSVNLYDSLWVWDTEDISNAMVVHKMGKLMNHSCQIESSKHDSHFTFCEEEIPSKSALQNVQR